jgi:hypothetical protein
MAVPDEVVKRWNLGKGDEVRVTILEGGLRIEPKQPSRIETISQEAIETYSKAVAGIQAKVSITGDNEVRLEFSGDDKNAVKFFVQKLWENLPLMFKLMGLGSVEELPHSEAKEQKEA